MSKNSLGGVVSIPSNVCRQRSNTALDIVEEKDLPGQGTPCNSMHISQIISKNLQHGIHVVGHQ